MSDQNGTSEDRKWMSLALDIAEFGAGYVSPNPMVGCVIVSSTGEKIGQGYHERYGQAHAETNAIEDVHDPSRLNGATVYVTLEPCSHHGHTPPCCEALAELPIRRVVVAMPDPNPKVDGKGIRCIRDSGIEVDVGLMREESERLNEFFLHFQNTRRPFVTLKIAQTADGYIAAPDGNSQWISGMESRRRVHFWRSRYDAVMVGRNTALVDNPRLTVRHVEGRQPRRIVVDGPLELPETLNLFTDQYEENTTVITWNREKVEKEADPMLAMLKSNYFRGSIVAVPRREGHCDLEEAFRELARRDVISILVEAGRDLATALLRGGLVDKVECFIAPKLLGGGTKSLLGLGRKRMEEILPFREHRWEEVGDDMLLTGYL